MSIMQRIIIIIGIIIVVTVSILGLKYSGYEKNFEETLELDKASITKLTMEIGGENKTTTENTKNNELFEQVNQVEYKRMRGDQTAYMPTIAYMLFDLPSFFYIPLD